MPEIATYTEDDIRDIGLCKSVYETLERHYPNHKWMVGANYKAGVVTIDLALGKPINMANYGYLLKIRSLDEPDAVKRVMLAGGEVLERFGLPRDRAPEDVNMRARQNGLNVDNVVGKSRY